MNDGVPYVVVCRSLTDMPYEAKRFIDSRNDIVKVENHQSSRVVTTKDKTEYIFICRSCFYRWCLGRTYKLIGSDVLWHSGERIGGVQDEQIE